MSCAKIAVGVAKNCANPLQTGAKDKLYLFNFEDFQDAALTRNVTNNQIIEGVVLPSGVTGFTYEGANGSIRPINGQIKGAFTSLYNHQVTYIPMDMSPTVKEEIEKKAKGRLVAIVEYNHKGADGNAAFEIYGLDSGLILESSDRDAANADTQGGYEIVIKSSENALEPHLPATIFNTNYTTTKALVEALVA